MLETAVCPQEYFSVIAYILVCIGIRVSIVLIILDMFLLLMVVVGPNTQMASPY